ncbi:MAG: glycoside hydrolase family 127 protein [Bacteroidales bacterium]
MVKGNLIITALAFVLIISCKSEKKQSTSYSINPVPFTEVKLNDTFWLPRIIKNAEVTIPIAFHHCEVTDRINNFAVAGGVVNGEHVGKRYNDSDVFKIMEGAAYSLSESYSPELDSYLDSLITLIGLAQEEDGYLYTVRTINPDKVPEYSGTERWSYLEQSHELYNVGHMYEAAVAHFQATGKRTFLNIAIKNADLIDKEFGWGKIEMYPGHQEIEIGLVKLYRITGEKKYLDLAKFFLDVRGPDGSEYMQSHQKVIEQSEAVGHAVRALYMYSGMADVATLTGNNDYISAIESIWINVVNKKMYVTGGLGQTGENEGFGFDYELPNSTAYCETCASIANVFWNQRMFLLTGEAKYIDVMERTMYNALLSGVSLSGDLFFYSNPLESDGSHERQEWFGCACCPSNICRFLPSVTGYIYASKGDDIFINLFIESETTMETPTGNIKITQQSQYPWDGKISIGILPEQSCKRAIFIRIPGWSRNEPVTEICTILKHPLTDRL